MNYSGKTFLALQKLNPKFDEIELNRKNFQLVDSNDFEKTTTPNGVNGYLTMDPRTFDSPRAQYMVLDKPALKVENTQPLQDIYSKENNVRPGFYNGYKDIKGGSIIYYEDLNNDLPYRAPIFTIQSYMKPAILDDPMNSTKTYYQRIPIPSAVESSSAYSFDRDQMEFREDLISKQQEIFYKNAYTPYNYYKNL